MYVNKQPFLELILGKNILNCYDAKWHGNFYDCRKCVFSVVTAYVYSTYFRPMHV